MNLIRLIQPIGLCTHHEPRSSIFKRNVISQILKNLKTRKILNRRTESPGEVLIWLLWTKTIWCWKNAVNTREEIGIGNESLKKALRVEPLIGSVDKLSYLIFYCTRTFFNNFFNFFNAENQDKSQRVEALYKALNDLPQPHYETLKYLMGHLYR